MRKLILAAIIFMSCNNAKDFQRSKGDTVQTTIIYTADLSTGVCSSAYSLRITKDSFDIDKTNQSSPELKWRRDTFYFIQINVPLKDKVGKPILDSLGKQKDTAQIVQVPNQYVKLDCNK